VPAPCPAGARLIPSAAAPPSLPRPLQLTIDRGELNTGFGGTQPKDFDIQRRIQIVYLDEQVRVARFLPSEDLQDSEDAGEDEILFVFRRASGGADEEEEEEDEEEDARALKVGSGAWGGRGGAGP
jgi:hypothetical protein